MAELERKIRRAADRRRGPAQSVRFAVVEILILFDYFQTVS
jgi:hypothetical protein